MVDGWLVIGVAVGKRQPVNGGIWGDWAFEVIEGCDFHTKRGYFFEPLSIVEFGPHVVFSLILNCFIMA